MRVAVCSYWYPPARTIASLRIAKFVKYLPEFGWEPFVFTVEPVTNRYTAAGALPDEALSGHVRRVPDPSLHVWIDRLTGRGHGGGDNGTSSPTSRFTRLAYRLYRDIACVPDETWPWLRHYAGIRRAAADAKVDLIFSSSPPATAHLIARRLAHDLGKPWVADLRDPWADTHTVDRIAARRWFDTRLEHRTLRDVAALTTVSRTMSRRFAAEYDKPVHVIMNGYDPDDLPADLHVAPEAERFTLVYTGMLYEGRRTPMMVFRALDELSRQGAVNLKRVAVKLFGRNLSIAQRELNEFPELSPSVELGGEIGYQESLVAQRRASVLLLLEWPDPRAAGVLTGKIFEYLAAGRPILAIGPRDGEIDQILRTTGRGILASTVEELTSEIKTLYDEFCMFGPRRVDVQNSSMEQFGRRAMTARLADVFRSTVTGVTT
jgi:glycosyltransferase involved in cell wall biosynthesis